MANPSRREFLLGMFALGTATMLAGCSQPRSNKADLEFFQFKSEAIDLFDGICEQFNAQHPDIYVKQNFQADNVTALRVRLVKEDMPDIVTINADYAFGDLARSGVFYDFAPTGMLDNVQDGVAQILPSLGQGGEGQINGPPLSTNGSGIIYNQEIFDQYRIEPPKTWDELIAIAEEFEAAGVDPFYWGFKDNWTGAPLFSSISGGFLTEGVANWYDKRRAGEESFETLRPVLEKMKQIAQFGNSNKFEIGYNDGNQGFAQGKAAMYVHGTYAIPAIRSYNPDIQLATFATPADREEDTKVVSGVDVALVMGTNPRYEEESLEFLSYVMAEENMMSYCEEQVAFPTLQGTSTTDEALIGLQPYFESDRIATYSDHNFPQGINLNNYMHQFLIDGNVDRFISVLDRQWDKVTSRITETE